MPIWRNPSDLVNLDQILTDNCPSAVNTSQFNCYTISLHCVEYTIWAKPHIRIENSEGEYLYTLFEIESITKRSI